MSFWFCLQRLTETFLIPRRMQQDMIINVYIFIQSTRHSCHTLMKIEFSRQIFEKNIQILNFMKILPVGADLVQAEAQTHNDGRIDR